MDWLVDHGSPSLRWFLQARYPLKVSQLVKVVRAYRRAEPLNLPLRLV